MSDKDIEVLKIATKNIAERGGYNRIAEYLADEGQFYNVSIDHARYTLCLSLVKKSSL